MHQHLNTAFALIYPHVLRRVLESPFLHQLEKQRRVLASGVGEDGLAARRKQPRHEVRESLGVTPFVEHVGGEDEVEGSDTFRIRRVPVEERGLWFLAHVSPGVVGGEIERGLVVISRKDLRAAGEGDDGREPHAAAEFDGALAGQVCSPQVLRQGDRARPQLGPVRESLVALEVLLVKEGVCRGGAEDVVGAALNLDEGFEQAGAAVEVRPEFV
jgi:hypothetical protein